MLISKDKLVSLAYLLSDADTQEILEDRSEEYFEYLHGHSYFIPALEELLEGAEVGDKFSRSLCPDQHYGDSDDEAQMTMALSSLGGESPELGDFFEVGEDEGGEPLIGRVVDLSDEDVVLDFNHPLAGRKLCFEIEVKAISVYRKKIIQTI